MPSSPTANTGTGTTITFGTSSYSALLRDVQWSGIDRPAVKTSHMGTSVWDTFIPGDLTNPGEATFEVYFNPDNTPPWTGAAETITVTFPPSSGVTTPAKWAASGFITSVEMSDPLEDVMTLRIGVKFSGAITVSAPA